MPTFEILIVYHLNFYVVVRDLNGNVNQSLFETLLNKIPILLIFS